MGFNKAILIGNIGQDPVLEKTKNGVSVVKLGLATNKQYTKESTGEKVKETQWHNIVLYKGQAETAAKYLKKGDQLCVEGEIRNSNYEAQDGTKKFYSEIVVSNMTMLGSSKPQSQNGDTQTAHVNESVPATPRQSATPQAKTPAKKLTPQNASVPSNDADVLGDSDDLPF